ncbi:MAG: hypothetical protein NVSMB6_15170 [Burkholderiaceae bacterium]
MQETRRDTDDGAFNFLQSRQEMLGTKNGMSPGARQDQHGEEWLCGAIAITRANACMVNRGRLKKRHAAIIPCHLILPSLRPAAPPEPQTVL